VAQYLITLVKVVVNVISVILILNALISFAPLEPWHPVRRFLNQLAEPIVRPFRNIIPPVGMFDLSVMVALIVVQLLGQVLIIMIQAAF
jgi:YggT family protein